MAAIAKVADLVQKMPEPDKGRILGNVNKEEMDKIILEIHQGGRESVLGLVDLLGETGKESDSKARHALHALAVYVSGLKDEAKRQAFAEALAFTLDGKRSKEVRAFVVRQLQVAGGKEVTAALGKLLLDKELYESAAQALLAIGAGAVEQFRAALPRANENQLGTILQALGVLRDAGSAEALKRYVADKNREARLAALWALANLGDASAAELLLKAADADGYERIKATQACLLLAERLLAAGRKKEAARIYTQLRDTRTEPGEQYIKEAATRGLAKVG